MLMMVVDGRVTATSSFVGCFCRAGETFDVSQLTDSNKPTNHHFFPLHIPQPTSIAHCDATMAQVAFLMFSFDILILRHSKLKTLLRTKNMTDSKTTIRVTRNFC